MGITRQQVIQLGREKGLNVKEAPITVDEMFNADELFLTGTTTEVLPVIEVNEKQIADGTPGLVSAQLFKAYRELLAEETGTD